MINEAKHIKELTSLGLSENEAKTYLTLLAKSSMTVGEIAKISGVPRPKLYEILTKLIVKGLCTEKIGKVKRYRVVDPNIVTEKLIRDYQAQLEQKKIIAQNFSNAIYSIYQQNMNKTDPLDYIQILKEKSRIAEKFMWLEKELKEELLAFSKAPYAFEFSENEDGFDALKRGIKIKSIYEVEDARELDFLKWVEMFAAAGEEVKIAYELPFKLAIFDEKTVMFALRDRVSFQPSLTSLVIEHPDFAKAFKRIFESCWQEAMTPQEFKIKSKGSTFGREKV